MNKVKKILTILMAASARGRAAIEEKSNGRFQIIITEIPYMVNKARMIENIADLVKEKRT